MRLCLLALAALAAAGPRAQGLHVHEAVTADAPGDTTGMRRLPVETAPGAVWVGRSVLALGPESVRTVGLEVGPDEVATLSLWLSEAAGAAFADLTAASVGRALAVVHDGRVLTAPVVESAIPNGLVLVTGLDAAEAERLADAIRGATGPPATPASWASTPREPGLDETPRRPPVRFDPPEGVETRPEAGALPWPPVETAPAEGGEATRVASGFVRAVAAREWAAAASALHPDAAAAVRPDALGLLRLDGATVRVREGAAEGAFVAADVLGRAPGSLDALSDRDLAALYLAGLDAVGAWGAPGPPRTAVGEQADGDRVHVVFRGASTDPGIAEVSVVTLRRDAAGRWGVLLTQARGF